MVCRNKNHKMEWKRVFSYLLLYDIFDFSFEIKQLKLRLIRSCNFVYGKARTLLCKNYKLQQYESPVNRLYAVYWKYKIKQKYSIFYMVLLFSGLPFSELSRTNVQPHRIHIFSRHEYNILNACELHT